VVFQCLLSCVTVALQQCYNWFTVMLQLCYNCVTVVLQLCYSRVTVVLRVCYKYDTVCSHLPQAVVGLLHLVLVLLVALRRRAYWKL
jgi:hypothetical protein